MAVYRLSSKKKNQGTHNVKKIVGFSMIVVASLVFLFLTGIFEPLQTFLLGVFGVFGFPLCVVMFVVGLALVNNRRYVMSVKYTICLALAVFFLLCILQLAIVGSNKVDGQTLSLGDYMAKNYLQKWTAGGIVIGLFSSLLLYAASWGAYIIFSLGFIICVALLLDSLNLLRRDKKENEPAKLQLKGKGVQNAEPVQVANLENKQVQTVARTEAALQEQPNVVLAGNLKEEQAKEQAAKEKALQEKKPLTAKQILGLDKKRNAAFEFDRDAEKNYPSAAEGSRGTTARLYDTPKSVEAKSWKDDPVRQKTIKEIILTPPEVNLDEFFKEERQKAEIPTKEEVINNITALKDEGEPSQIFHEDEFRMDATPFIRRTLPQKPRAEDLVARADDILRSAIAEEKSENPEYYENLTDKADALTNEEKNSNYSESSANQSENSFNRAENLAESQTESHSNYSEKSDNSNASSEKFSPLDNLPQRDNSGRLSSGDEEKNDDDSVIDGLLRDVHTFDEPQTPDADNFSSRNDFSRGGFSRDGEFGRRDFSREREAFNQSLRAREDRTLSQDDRDARAAFHRESERMNMRNGGLSREIEPIPEEEPEVVEPYEYEIPPIDLITTQSVDLSTLNEDVAQKRLMLENTLDLFGVPAKVQGVVIGPAVTRYELEMPQGISVQKIKNRADDIALSLAAEGTIRIEAPVPGKSVVGIEVPNASIATVSLKDVLISKEFQQATSPLTFALGKDITGRIICADMRKLTHLLVAGSTGSGKSVCLNSIILSIIYKASPEDVKIILIDPKRVEFASYEALPHLIMPQIVCDTQKAINTLTWAVNEMERRFDAMGKARVREISEFNQCPDVLEGRVKKMPYLVIIVDELADLMMTGKKEVEEKVCRLAQKARAAGIHLILATQRPSTDVITGLIKANFPSRISFAVASSFDSMTILDRVGAEKLLGKGDMFYFPNGAKDPSRVQGCFVTTNEINHIVDYCKDNNRPIFDPEIEQQINNPNKGNGNGGPGYNNEMDELLPQALKVSIECGQASATMIRRKFAIGYPRAARIIDQMETAGYISSADGPKGRTVYTTEEEFKELFGDID